MTFWPSTVEDSDGPWQKLNNLSFAKRGLQESMHSPKVISSSSLQLGIQQCAQCASMRTAGVMFRHDTATCLAVPLLLPPSSQACRRFLARNCKYSPSPNASFLGRLQMEWELKIPQLAMEAGAELISDEEPAFDMEWRDVMEFWEVLLDCC